jgi:hypothetical protein
MWTNPKIDWTSADPVGTQDFRRIEQNINEIASVQSDTLLLGTNVIEVSNNSNAKVNFTGFPKLNGLPVHIGLNVGKIVKGGRTTGDPEIRGCTYIESSDKFIYSDWTNDEIYVLDGFTETVNQTYPTVGTFTGSLSNDGTNLLEFNQGTTPTTVHVHSGFTSTIASTITVPVQTQSILTDGTNLISIQSGIQYTISIHSGFTSTISQTLNVESVLRPDQNNESTAISYCEYIDGKLYSNFAQYWGIYDLDTNSWDGFIGFPSSVIFQSGVNFNIKTGDPVKIGNGLVVPYGGSLDTNYLLKVGE